MLPNVREVRTKESWIDVYYGPYSFVAASTTPETSHCLLMLELRGMLANVLWTAFPFNAYMVTDRLDAERKGYWVKFTRIEFPAEAVSHDKWLVIDALLTLSHKPQWMNLVVSCKDADGDLLALYVDDGVGLQASAVDPFLSDQTQTLAHQWPQYVMRQGQVFKCGQKERLEQAVCAVSPPCSIDRLQAKFVSLDRTQPVTSNELRGKLYGHYHVPVFVNHGVARLLRYFGPQLAVAALTHLYSNDSTSTAQVDPRFVLPKSEEGVLRHVALPVGLCARLLHSPGKRMPLEFLTRSWGGKQGSAQQLGGKLSYAVQVLISQAPAHDLLHTFWALTSSEAPPEITTALQELLDPTEIEMYHRICVEGFGTEDLDKQALCANYSEKLAKVVVTPWAAFCEGCSVADVLYQSPKIKTADRLPELVSRVMTETELSEDNVECHLAFCCGRRKDLECVDTDLNTDELREVATLLAGEDMAPKICDMMGFLRSDDSEDEEALAKRLTESFGLSSDLLAGVQFNEAGQALAPEEEEELKKALKELGLENLLESEDDSSSDSDSSDSEVDEEQRSDQFDAFFREQLEKLIVDKKSLNGDAIADLAASLKAARQHKKGDLLAGMHDGLDASSILFSEIKK